MEKIIEEIFKNKEAIKEIAGQTGLLLFAYFFGKNVVYPLFVKLIDYLIQKDNDFLEKISELTTKIGELITEIKQKPCLIRKRKNNENGDDDA